MEFLYIIIRVLMNVCLVCGNHKMQCMCRCTTDHNHSFKCACGGALNWTLNRRCDNCMDIVHRDIGFDGMTRYELHEGQCEHCLQTASPGNNIRIGWCQNCREIERVAEQNRLAGCTVDEDEVNEPCDCCGSPDPVKCLCDDSYFVS